MVAPCPNTGCPASMRASSQVRRTTTCSREINPGFGTLDFILCHVFFFSTLRQVKTTTPNLRTAPAPMAGRAWLWNGCIPTCWACGNSGPIALSWCSRTMAVCFLNALVQPILHGGCCNLTGAHLPAAGPWWLLQHPLSFTKRPAPAAASCSSYSSPVVERLSARRQASSLFLVLARGR